MIPSRSETLIYQRPAGFRVSNAAVFLLFAAVADLIIIRKHDLAPRLAGMVYVICMAVVALRYLLGFSVTLACGRQAVRIRQLFTTTTVPLSAISSVDASTRAALGVARPMLVVHLRNGSDRRFRGIVGRPMTNDTDSDLLRAISPIDDLIRRRSPGRPE